MTCLIRCPTFLRKVSSPCLLCSVTPGHPWKMRMCSDNPAVSNVWSVGFIMLLMTPVCVTDLNARVRDIDTTIDSELPERVPAFAWGQGAEAAVCDQRPREREAGEARTWGQPPHPGVWHLETASEVNMGQWPGHTLEAGVTNSSQMTEVQVGQELVTHQDLTHMTIDHHVIIVLFTLITLLIMIRGQLIEAHGSKHSSDSLDPWYNV